MHHTRWVVCITERSKAPPSVWSVTDVKMYFSECGYTTYNGVSPFIVNGNDASEGEWPWQVGITKNGYFTCGGTLVSSRHVVTAAHCLAWVSPSAWVLTRSFLSLCFLSIISVCTSSGGFPPRAYAIIAGTTHRGKLSNEVGSSQDGKVFLVKAIVKHPGFTYYYLGDDIAILILATDVEFSDFIRPACLPEADEIIPLSSLCYSTGWGNTDPTDGVWPFSIARFLDRHQWSFLLHPRHIIDSSSSGGENEAVVPVKMHKGLLLCRW